MVNQHSFHPTTPLRTNTAESQNSQSSGQLSPTSPTSRATSPTEQSFFGAITARVRGRSRSRSRDASHKRSKSPMMSPPRHVAQQQQQSRHISIATPEQPVRPSMHTKRQSTGSSDPWRGRHSNEWLFGGWSATETAKNFVRRQS